VKDKVNLTKLVKAVQSIAPSIPIFDEMITKSGNNAGGMKAYHLQSVRGNYHLVFAVNAVYN